MITFETSKHGHGFTLVELLVALMVTSIIMTAVVTLAFALGAVNDSSNDTAQKQAEVRYATLRISELIRHCKLICSTANNDIAIWKADDNPNNGKIDVLELAYIETGENRDCISILEFSTCPDWLELWLRSQPSQINTLQNNHSWWKNLFISRCSKTRPELISKCSNTQFSLDTDAPQTRFVNISFGLEENGTMHDYQISASLRAWAGNLLDSSGEIVDRDDD